MQDGRALQSRDCGLRARQAEAPTIFVQGTQGELANGSGCGIELLNAEAALFRSAILHMLISFQQNRFASNGFLVRSASEARACLLRQGFQSAPQTGAMLIDSETNRAIRLMEVGRDK
jgi:hypothetical protein